MLLRQRRRLWRASAIACSLGFPCVSFSCLVSPRLCLRRFSTGRNKEFLDLAVKVTMDIVFDVLIVKSLPQRPESVNTIFSSVTNRLLRLVRRVVAACMSNAMRTIRRAIPHLKPIIDERKVKIQEHGLGELWPGKPVSRGFCRCRARDSYCESERHAPVGPGTSNSEGGRQRRVHRREDPVSQLRSYPYVVQRTSAHSHLISPSPAMTTAIGHVTCTL